jgi:hypothetical protein
MAVVGCVMFGIPTILRPVRVVSMDKNLALWFKKLSSLMNDLSSKIDELSDEISMMTRPVDVESCASQRLEELRHNRLKKENSSK